MDPIKDIDMNGASLRDALVADGRPSGVIRDSSEPRRVEPLGLARSLAYFGVPSAAFFLVAHGLIPLLVEAQVHPALAWFVGGYVTFVPLFALALVLGRQEARRTGVSLVSRLRLEPLNRGQWLWTLAGALAVLLGTGAVMGVAGLTSKALGLPGLETTPAFMAFEPFRGSERLLLLVWAPMFFFNIVGEELFWRGYILPRQEQAFPRRAWFLNACLWAIFHVAFGWQLLLVLLPILFVQPYIAQRTRSTWPGIVIHGVLNGPMFVAISLGALG